MDDAPAGGQRPGADDRQSVADLGVRYVLALDSKDWDTVADCFTPDAVFLHPGGRVDGPDGIVARARGALEPLDASQHLIGSQLVEVDGDEASMVAYFQAQHVRAAAEDGPLYTIAGSYRDRLRRTASGWQIYERVQAYAWKSGNPAVIVR